jgi:hypothetical protein
MATDIVLRQCVADAMVTCPKTLAPDSQLREIYALFADEHVHMALVVDLDGRLITTIERPDPVAGSSGQTSLVEVGTLTGRIVGPSDDLAATKARLFREGRRRLAVIDDAGCLIGLLCLKRDGAGFCSDEGVRERSRHAGALSTVSD